MLWCEQLFSVRSHPCVFRMGWERVKPLLLCYFFQVHNLPSCPVLKNFQQTVERRSVDSMLFLLEDGSRWLPVSMPPALGVVLGLPRVDELHHLDLSVKSSALSQEHELGKGRPRCGLMSYFADSSGESSLWGIAVRHWGRQWMP